MEGIYALTALGYPVKKLNFRYVSDDVWSFDFRQTAGDDAYAASENPNA